MRHIQHGLLRLGQQKRSLHADFIRVMKREDSEEFSTQKIDRNQDLSTADEKEIPKGGYLSFTDLIILQKQGKHKEALEFAQSSLARVTEEKRWSTQMQGYANFVCACACANVIKYCPRDAFHSETDSIPHLLLRSSRKAIELEEKAGLEFTVMTRSFPYLIALTWAIKLRDPTEKERLFGEAEGFLEKVYRQLETYRPQK